MTLKQRLIKEIDSLPPEDLVVVQNIVSALTRKTRKNIQKTKDSYLKARKALSGCTGNLSEDIIKARDDRV